MCFTAKANPHADIGVDFDSINRKEKRQEKKINQAPVVSTITMGKAMGAGSGIGRAGAGAMAPPNPMGAGRPMGMVTGAGYGGGMGMNRPMGMGMGMGMNQQQMGMGMGMNQQPMGMGMNQQPMGGMHMGMNQGMPMRPPMGMGPGGMPGAGYNQTRTVHALRCVGFASTGPPDAGLASRWSSEHQQRRKGCRSPQDRQRARSRPLQILLC